MQNLRRSWNYLLDLFGDDEPGADEPLYDPVHVIGVLMVCLLVLGFLYWLLWSLLVCEGGLFVKIIPFLQVLFSSKTLKDFGYEGYPYQLGIFEGWIVNVAALVLTLGVIVAIWFLFKKTDPKKKEGNS